MTVVDDVLVVLVVVVVVVVVIVWLCRCFIALSNWLCVKSLKRMAMRLQQK